MDVFFSAVLDIARLFWWVFFVGWWAWCLNRAHKATDPSKKRTWLFVPTFVTIIAVVMSLGTVHAIYNGVDWQCAAHEFGCMADEQATDMYYRSLREKVFLHSWLNAFGDSVVWLQCLWLWLLLPFLIYRKLQKRERAQT